MTFRIKSIEELRDEYVRTVKNSLEKLGVTNPAVGPGTEPYIRGQAIATLCNQIQANAAIMADQLMADTATGEYLDRHCASYGITRRKAGPAYGYITFDTDSSTFVAGGTELVDPTTNARFQVIFGSVYADGDRIQIKSSVNGASGNVAGGTILRWSSQPAYAAPTVTVDAAGLSGGTDDEDDETLRARLMERIANPPKAGNSAHVIELAEAASSEVQKAFCYPAANGPSTVHVAVAGYASASNTRSRLVSDAALANVRSALENLLPESVEVVATKCVEVPFDIAFYLVLPDAVTAIPSGIGGGWIDGNPFPKVKAVGAMSELGKSAVVSVTSSTVFEITSNSLPTIGDSVSWISYATKFQLFTATIIDYSYTGTGPYNVTITIDAPFTGITIDDLVFPAAENTEAYLVTVLNSFARLGPGEKTSMVGALPRAMRRPKQPDWPYVIDSKFIQAMNASSGEVLDSSFSYTRNSATGTDYRSTKSNTERGVSIAEGPQIFVPRRIAFYQP